MLLDKKTYPLKFYVISGVGSGIILAAGFILTYILWKNGLGDTITPSNFQSSIISSSGASGLGGTTPFALMSITVLLYKVVVKRFRNYLKIRFNQ